MHPGNADALVESRDLLPESAPAAAERASAVLAIRSAHGRKAVALAHALSKDSFEKVPATNLACLHALNTSINLVIIQLCKSMCETTERNIQSL